MNILQARMLVRVMEAGQSYKRWPDDPDPVLHATIEPTGSDNDYSVKLWSPATTLDRWPDTLYLGDDGRVYVWDADRDEPVYVRPYGEWRSGRTKHMREFVFEPELPNKEAATT